jgi:hypothetical protein
MKRSQVALPAMFSVLAFLGFLRLPGADKVTGVQIATLIATGMCLGVAIAHLFLRRAKPQP